MIDLLPHKESSTTARLTETPFAPFTPLPFILAIFKRSFLFCHFHHQHNFLGMDHFIPSSAILVKIIPLSGSIHSVPKLSRSKTTTSRNESDFKPNIQELLSSIYAKVAPKPYKISNRLLANAPKINLSTNNFF